MKLTYLMWGYSHDSAIIKAFREAGLTVETVLLSRDMAENPVQAWEEKDRVFPLGLGERIRTAAGDIVFSVNFFASVSDFCQEEKIPYCSWVLQLPDFDLYTAAVRNPCNYLGLCDSYLVEKLWQMGIQRTFFLPDAVELEGERKKTSVEKGACFVARYPKDSLHAEKMTKYSKGYLEAFLHAQRVLYGASILENGLLFKVQQEVLESNPVPSRILAKMRNLFIADRYLAPKCDRIRQDIFLYKFASIMTIYSDGEFSDCNAKKRPFAEEEGRRQEIYAEKEFTLVFAPYAMHNGIPRETLEVIAAGGFPIAGFVRDYAYFFQKDETLAYFTNPSEFSQAIMRYGNSGDERERVREAAFCLLREAHTYKYRIDMMLEMWERL